MYSQLLAASLEVVGTELDNEAQRREALVHFIQCRNDLHFGRLPACDSTDRLAREDRIVLQLRYDLALLRVCGQRGIASDPSQFVKPLSERRRLEIALTESGFELDQTV